MISDSIHAYLLISLRALLEFDPIEYRRSTDLSKSELDAKINQMVEKASDQELKRFLDDFKRALAIIDSPEQASFLFSKFYGSGLRNAQLLSTQYSHTEHRESFKVPESIEVKNSNVESLRIRPGDELLKLSVMRLLKDLKGYSPKFNYLWKNREIDCLLEPLVTNNPFIVIETKSRIVDRQHMEKTISDLASVQKFWGSKTIAVLIVGSYPLASKVLGHFEERRTEPKNFYTFFYDIQTNSISGRGYTEFIKRIDLLE